ncbi:MAG: site-specific DNA-methyltransferase [Fretibacterium sp.]|nr:site-specific DNA-methyltransferase [Fretibacterium sp.]
MSGFDSLTGYSTYAGCCACGDSLKLLEGVEDESVDLVITSPPFALQRKKPYGNAEQEEYVEWLCRFGRVVFQKLKASGSFVLDIGGAYEKGLPVYSLYQFRVLLALCDGVGFRLAQPFYWHNPGALPAPIEWVNKRKLRAKTSVNTVWWLCKSGDCKADVTKVLTPYSPRMERLIAHPEDFVKEEGTRRPSGHVLGQSSWVKDNGGAIPPNLLQISNTESNGQYLRYCKTMGLRGHPARFPAALPEFFIKFLTNEGDLVVDIFAGSNTTGQAAERLGRRWLSFENIQEYVASSVFRFAGSMKEARDYYTQIKAGKHAQIASNETLTLPLD